MDKEQKFKKAFEVSKDQIYRLCLGFMGNHEDADDLFQEVYIKVWNNLDAFREESQITTWIYKIASNTALLHVSKRNKATALTSTQKPEDLHLPELENTTRYTDKDLKRLYQAIATLKERDRIIIGLLFENTKYEEIAEIVGISTSHVGVRISRIKKTLAKILS